MLIAFHKPFGVLSQFTSDGSPHRTLAAFDFPGNVYPIGRLDADSEGLLLLSDEAALNQRLLLPKHAHVREYFVQVERQPSREALRELERGPRVQGRATLPCRARILEPPPEVAATPSSQTLGDEASPPRIAPRDPPIRYRKTVPTCWLALELVEGKNRQVRRMTAAIGHPTLRLVRVRIGRFELGGLAPGAWKILSSEERKRVLG